MPMMPKTAAGAALGGGREPVKGAARVWRTASWAGLLALTLALGGCATLRAATAPGGARPGVDVPTGRDELSAIRLGTPALAPAGQGGYAFLQTSPDGSPVTFDPCRPLHFVIRPVNEPPGGRELVLGALADLSDATGLQLADDGLTDEEPTLERASYQPARYGDRWAPVLIAWSTPAETLMLPPDALGSAGPATFGTDPDGLRFVSGTAVFNGPALEAQLRLGEDQKARAVVLHELGHLVGLDHVGDPYQVMFDTNAYPLPSYQAGDRRGLERLGSGRCFTDY